MFSGSHVNERIITLFQNHGKRQKRVHVSSAEAKQNKHAQHRYIKEKELLITCSRSVHKGYRSCCELDPSDKVGLGFFTP